MKYEDQKHGRAEYGSYVQISQEYWDTLEQEPLSGLALKEQYFSRMVHVTNSMGLSSGGIAESTIPTPVADGEPVATWYDQYGRQVIFGANLSLNALDVNNINDPIISRLGPVTNLDAVVATGAGVSVDVSNYHNFTIHIIASAVTDGGTMTVEHSLDNVNWVTVSTNVIDADGVDEISISNQAYRYLRTNLTLRTDGTYTTTIYAGN
jgi:hypothetical protein